MIKIRGLTSLVIKTIQKDLLYKNYSRSFFCTRRKEDAIDMAKKIIFAAGIAVLGSLIFVCKMVSKYQNNNEKYE